MFCVLYIECTVIHRLVIYVFQESDAKAQVDPDWVEMSQAEEVLKQADKTPEHLKSIKEEDVSTSIRI